jgi:cholesterol transport system auxiliary component
MKISLAWLPLCACLLLSGYGCYRQAEDARYFLLEVQRDGNPQTLSKDGILTVRPFSLSPGYHPKELTYRTGDFQYESDYYNRFITDAGRQIAEQTRRWLSDSGLFAHVVPPGSTMSATHLLEGNITRLYGDFRDKNNAQAVVEITFYLLDIKNRNPEILFHETMNITTAVSENKVELLIEAYNAGLTKILTQLERKLAQSLPSLEVK